MPSAAATDRIVLATGPLLGILEPCRCTEGMLGGMPRRASLVARFAGTGPLLVDLGDLAKPDEGSETALELTESAAIEALATIATITSRTAVVAFGCTESRLGVERLEKIARPHAGKVVFLATGLCKNNELVASESLQQVFLDEQNKLAVYSAVDRGLVPPPEGYAFQWSGEARAEKTRVVVLYHGEPAAAERDLGKKVGVDIIICGHAEHAEPTRQLASGATLVTLETKGQRLRALALDAKGFKAEATHDLDALVPDRKAARDVLDRLYEREAELLPEAPKKKLDEQGGSFVGSESCRDCHRDAWTIWQATKHAHALERLREKDPRRAKLAECLRCHTVGFDYEGGWKPDTPEGLDAVGCESCHGPGSNHVARARANPDDAPGFGRPTGKWPLRWRSRCLVCHDPANSPGFDLEGYLTRIRHWKSEER